MPPPPGAVADEVGDGVVDALGLGVADGVLLGGGVVGGEDACGS
jgi:hypothetical protein